MADAKSAAIQIKQINLRIPGRDAAFGHRVSEQVARLLADKAPLGWKHQIGALNLRLQTQRGATEVEISYAVANSVLGALNKVRR